MYPRSGFRSGGTSAKTTLLENHPFGNPRLMVASVVRNPTMIRVRLSRVDGPLVSRPSGCCWFLTTYFSTFSGFFDLKRAY